MKVFLSTASNHYANWLPNPEIVDSIEDADLVLFTGGEDVSPEFYDEPKHHSTYSTRSRDIKEIVMFDKAISLGKPILGICRGSQLSCVMAGGKLIQDQNNPAMYHPIITSDGLTLEMSSTHHQAQHPFNLPEEDYEILAWSEGLIKYRTGGNGEEMETPKDCEVVYYPKINALAIQGHPEMLINQNRFEDTLNWCKIQLSKLNIQTNE